MTQITIDRALVEQALGALENLQPIIGNGLLNKIQLAFIDPNLDVAITALRAAMAQQVEPVAWYSVDQPLNYMTRCADGTKFTNAVVMPAHAVSWAYTTPPQRKPLTEEEIGRICDAHWSLRQLARAVERAHGIKE